MSDRDGQLVERARGGDSIAFEELVRRHLRAAHAVAFAVLGEAADADDVCQDAFITALERLDQCRKPERFRAWLLSIVRNRARSALRAAGTREAIPLDYAAGLASGGSASDRAERSELRDALVEALDGLTEVQREVVLLHDLEGWKHREIAAALEMPVGTVRSHLHYARRALRDALGAKHMEEH